MKWNKNAFIIIIIIIIIIVTIIIIIVITIIIIIIILLLLLLLLLLFSIQHWKSFIPAFNTKSEVRVGCSGITWSLALLFL